MQPARALLVGTIRLAGGLLVAYASLQLSLAVAHEAFLLRQGEGSTAGIPLIVAWIGVVVAGLGLYVRGARLGDRLMTVIQARRPA